MLGSRSQRKGRDLGGPACRSKAPSRSPAAPAALGRQRVPGGEHPPCAGGLAGALELVGERWTLLIVREAMDGVSRFDDFHAHLGLSRRSLSARLARLVQRGLMTKTPYQHNPIRCDYCLTAKGLELQAAITALTAWGDVHAR